MITDSYRLLWRGISLFIFLAGGLAVSAAEPGPVINDVTQLNPIQVQRVLAPKAIKEIVDAVKTHSGPISIGGGRYSMGGQTATEGALQIDMRQFDKVVTFSKEKKEITVQTGITWRKIQEYIDPYDLSLQIMQTYANFTVGGSLSVNVHGRYIGKGPLVLSVKSIRVVLANGRVVEASPARNQEIFYGAIGGYGGLGVIVEATLDLTDNVKVERESVVMPLSRYREFFSKNVRDNSSVIFHNADIYPDAFDTVRVTSYVKTDKPVTVEQRLHPKDQNYWLDRLVLWRISELPFGKASRQHIIDPLLFMGKRVEWRNYEASYDVAELEPASRKNSTYVLQEYFVPVEKLEQFVPKMAEILNRHKVNTINVSIRHARPDPGTLLAWARNEVFAYVLYYKQGTSEPARKEVGVWTRELIDAAVSLGGAYYLPYQIHATDEQFHAAYPNADSFFALKKKLDPTNKFRNKLWDAYYKPGLKHSSRLNSTGPPARGVVSTVTDGRNSPPNTDSLPNRSTDTNPDTPARIRDELPNFKGYKRDEAQTYLTLPEWLLVYSPDEYAQFLKNSPPSAFPYFGSIAQFWSYYWDVYKVTREKYPFNWGYHVMVFVIGSSFTVENAVKGIYENTVGRITEWLANDAMTAEDVFAAKVAQDYVDFIRVDPWYEFAFASRLKRLWVETDLMGPNLIRKWERKLYLSAEYTAKAQYAMLIKLATKAAYGDADTEMFALVENISPDAFREESKIKVVRKFEDASVLLSLPRYEEFRDVVLRLSRKGVRFREIAGNQEILLTAVVPADWNYDLSDGKVLFEKPILTRPAQKRVSINAPVQALHEILLQLTDRNYFVEHIYDY